MDFDQYVVNGFELDHVRNHSEIRVIQALQKILPQYPQFHQCQICIEDAYAAALVNLPHEYIQEGTTLAQSQVSDQELEDEVCKAIVKVMEHPRHS